MDALRRSYAWRRFGFSSTGPQLATGRGNHGGFCLGSGAAAYADGTSVKDGDNCLAWPSSHPRQWRRNRAWRGFVAVGLLILTGLDKHLQTALIELMPAWLSDLTTYF